MNDNDRAVTRAWVDRWRSVGRALEEQRTQDLARLDDETARQITRELFTLWRPSESERHECGLVDQQRLFSRLALRQSSSNL